MKYVIIFIAILFCEVSYSQNIAPDTVITSISPEVQKSIVVSPNPFYNDVSISGYSFDDFSLVSLDGKTVSKTNSHKIDTKKVTPGNYILIMRKGSSFVARRVIKKESP